MKTYRPYALYPPEYVATAAVAFAAEHGEPVLMVYRDAPVIVQLGMTATDVSELWKSVDVCHRCYQPRECQGR